METTTYTPADVKRAQSLAKTLRDRAARVRKDAVDVEEIVDNIPAIVLGARQYDYEFHGYGKPYANASPRPTPDGIKHIALVTDAIRSREHALTRLAGVLEVTAAWLEDVSKFNAPAPAPEVEVVEVAPVPVDAPAPATAPALASEG